MDALKARKAVEDLATYFVALNEAKEDCKAQVASRLELLVSEDETPITKEDIRNLKRAGRRSRNRRPRPNGWTRSSTRNL